MEKYLKVLTAAAVLLVPNMALGSQPGDPNAAPTANSASSDSDSTSQSAASPLAPADGEASTRDKPVMTLSGADVATPQSIAGGRSYLLGSFGWTGSVDTSPYGVVRSSKIFTRSTYLGGLTLQRVRRLGQTNLHYQGGAFFYNTRRIDNSNGNANFNLSTSGTFQSLGIRQTLAWRRWEVEFADQGLYLPDASFGFTEFGGLSSFGSGLGKNFFGTAPILNPSFEPNQTIFTGGAARLSNLAVTQVQFNASRRSAFTATGMYGLLHFLRAGFIDSNYWEVMAGYNHALTPRNTISIGYMHDLIRFDVDHREILNRGFRLAYGRKIAGRLVLVISGGPMASQIALPFGGAITRSFWNTYDSLQYSFRKGSVAASFVRYTTAGAGVLLGAETDWATLSAGRRLTRRSYGSLDFGHAYNQSLTRETALQRRSKYESWSAGFTLSREFRESMSFYLNYRFYWQTSNNPGCFGAGCAPIVRRHVGSVGLNWHSRPIRIG